MSAAVICGKKNPCRRLEPWWRRSDGRSVAPKAVGGEVLGFEERDERRLAKGGGPASTPFNPRLIALASFSALIIAPPSCLSFRPFTVAVVSASLL